MKFGLMFGLMLAFASPGALAEIFKVGCDWSEGSQRYVLSKDIQHVMNSHCAVNYREKAIILEVSECQSEWYNLGMLVSAAVRYTCSGQTVDCHRK